VDTKDSSTGKGRRDDALSVLKDIDSYTNLHKGIVVLAFMASATMGISAFFLTLDFTKWLDIDVVEPWMQISIPYALTFIVWIFAFFSIQSILYMMGGRDLDAVARDRLSSLNLNLDELDQLRRDLEVNEFKHKTIFEGVISDLAIHNHP
jgi:hypothetical protein